MRKKSIGNIAKNVGKNMLGISKGRINKEK